MSDYDQLRHFADSWGLVLMMALFITFVGWTFRRGASARLDAEARSIFAPDPAETDDGQ